MLFRRKLENIRKFAKEYKKSIISCAKPVSVLSKDETRRDSSLVLMISHYTVIKTMLCIFVYGSLGGCKCDRNT